MTTFRVEVLADNSGTWAGNAVKFDTVDEAQAWAKDLWSRWTAVRAWRVVRESDDGVMVSGKS